MRNRKPHDDNAESVPRLVPLSRVLMVVVLAALISGVAVAAVDRLALGAPAGPQGEPGPPGPTGDASEVDADEVLDAIESDPARLDGMLDPAPSDLGDRDDELSGEIEQVASDLESLCSSLSLSDALFDESLSCP